LVTVIDTITVPGGDPVDIIAKGDEKKDPADLCGAQHQTLVGLTPNATNIVPFDTQIAVSFRAFDSSGCGDACDFLGDAMQLVGGSFGAVWGDFFNPWDDEHFLDPNATSRTMQENIPPDSNAGKALTTIGCGACAIYGFGSCRDNCAEEGTHGRFAAENSFTHKPKFFNAYENNMFGTNFTEVAAASHKVLITITNTYEGKVTQKFETELAGCVEMVDDSGSTIKVICPGSYAWSYFTIDAPGLWTVNVKSYTSGTCASPGLDVTTEFQVAKPEGWTPGAGEIETLGDITEVLKSKGLPIGPLAFLVTVGLALLLVPPSDRDEVPEESESEE